MATHFSAENPPSTDPDSSTSTFKRSIPSHPAPTDAAATSSGVAIDSQASSGRRQSTHADADAARAMAHTNSWQPAFKRRQSWNKEDQKHELHMTSIDGVKTGPGFSERR